MKSGKLSYAEVTAVRERFSLARENAAARFREAFAAAPADLPPEERWRAHLEIQADAFLEICLGVTLPEDSRLIYVLDERQARVIYPVIVKEGSSGPPVDPAELAPTRALFPWFHIEQNVSSLLEYWMLVSELLSSSESHVTKLIASRAELDGALRSMVSPQLVQVLYVNFEPDGEWRDDGTAMLALTLYSRAEEERIERRQLTLDGNNEFHFHSRELVAEGTGGVRLSRM